MQAFCKLNPVNRYVGGQQQAGVSEPEIVKPHSLKCRTLPAIALYS